MGRIRDQAFKAGFPVCKWCLPIFAIRRRADAQRPSCIESGRLRRRRQKPEERELLHRRWQPLNLVNDLEDSAVAVAECEAQRKGVPRVLPDLIFGVFNLILEHLRYRQRRNQLRRWLQQARIRETFEASGDGA